MFLVGNWWPSWILSTLPQSKPYENSSIAFLMQENIYIEVKNVLIPWLERKICPFSLVSVSRTTEAVILKIGGLRRDYRTVSQNNTVNMIVLYWAPPRLPENIFWARYMHILALHRKEMALTREFCPKLTAILDFEHLTLILAIWE